MSISIAESAAEATRQQPVMNYHNAHVHMVGMSQTSTQLLARQDNTPSAALLLTAVKYSAYRGPGSDSARVGMRSVPTAGSMSGSA